MFDGLFREAMRACGVLVLLVIVAIGIELVLQTLPIVQKMGFSFFTSTTWDPVMQVFGAWPAIYGTLVSTLIAIVIAVPLSLAIAIFLNDVAPTWISKPVGMAIELLAAIPSIIYGMWGLFVLAPILGETVQPWMLEYLGFIPLFQGPPMGIGMMTAGLILALMILPYITSVTRDVLRLIPSVMKESAYGMGCTLWEVTRSVSIPYGLRGILGAVFLGLGRALGETMAVTFVIGNSHTISTALFDPAGSIASALANEFNEASDPLHVSALMGLGFSLFIITFCVQVLSQTWVKRVQKNQGRL